jgi:hypothetical protein
MRMSKETVFVCSAIVAGDIVSKILTASTIEEAQSFFEKDTLVKPTNISGPFYHKKTSVIKKNTEIKFQSGNSKKAAYKGWRVTAMTLAKPEGSAFVFFDQRIDGQKMQKPDTTIVRIEELENEIA